MLAEWYGDWSGVAGLAVGVAGFIITIILLLKSKSAALAAEKAAKATAKELGRIQSIVTITTLRSHTKEVIAELRTPNFRAAAIRCLDLREGLSQVRTSDGGGYLLPDEEWQFLLVTVTQIHDSLERLARDKKAVSGRATSLITDSCRVLDFLNKLSIKATNAIGDNQ